MKEQLIRFYCGAYNTLVDSAISWIEPTDIAKWEAIDALGEAGITVDEDDFLESIRKSYNLFNPEFGHFDVIKYDYEDYFSSWYQDYKYIVESE